MVIHDYEKINISFCTYSKTTVFFQPKEKTYIHVICIFCKLEKNVFGRRSPIYYSWYLNFLSVKKGARELIGAPDGVQLSLKLILDDRRLKSVFHHFMRTEIFYS